MSTSEDLTKQVEKQMNGGVTIIVFGASGDLAKKMTFPALYALHKSNHLPKQTAIIGYARSELDREDYMRQVATNIKEEENKEQLDTFKKICHYFAGGYDDEASYKKLKETVEQSEKERGLKQGQRNRLFYLATPPGVFLDVAKGCQSYLMPSEDDKSIARVIIEKPFGRDVASCQELLKGFNHLFSESDMYRIDHFLGKEMIKNIITLRFANTMFSPLWDQKYISSIQITLKETSGCEGRGGYFEDYGAIRDVVQNHLLQIMSLIAMERPVGFEAEAIRDEKVKLLKSVKPVELKDTLIGQYVAAKGGEEEKKDKPSYVDDEAVPKDSITPTFATTVLWVDNERWQGVPFILKSGKALDVKKGEVRIQFKRAPGNLYSDVVRNELVIGIEPDECVYMKFNNKTPGLSVDPIVTDLNLTYKDRYKNLNIPKPYESLFLDVMLGNHANFVRDDELVAAWKIFTPVLQQLEKEKVKPEPYEFGSRGPDKENEFMERYGVERLSSTSYSWPKQDVK
ncbi:glucose-6-phosphate dehydrogenase [Cunninghamella echinulata]|nr:glucose-6-phosphate dehydrogenase [Cunninghamella echinulata]